MRFRKLFPVLTIATAISLAACAEEGADEGEDITADTTEMAPAPAPMPTDTMVMPGDTVLMIDTTGQM
jgi:hypothetical protein